MKRAFFIFSTLGLCVMGAQTRETVQVKTPVKSVILYLDGAEVSQSKQVHLNPGYTAIVFSDLSPKLISKSIQVNVGPEVTVLSVSDKINFLRQIKGSGNTAVIHDSIEIMSDLVTQVSMQIQAFEQEKTMLQKNESIGGQDKGVSITELKLAADFYRARLKEINTELFTLRKKQDKSNRSLSRLRQQLIENGETEIPTAEITVLVSATSKVSTNIDLKYVVKESGWTPAYDLISEDVNKPVVLKYRAKVFNNSGIDWSDVKLKLSTADPMRSASKPEISPWYLNFGQPAMYLNNSNYSNQRYDDQQNVAQAQSLYEIEISADKKSKGGKKQEEVIQYEELQVSELSAEFDIKQTYSIPSDARPYNVDVVTYSLNATFQYYSVPKIEKEAFMLARITGWEELDLVEGPANVYLAGTFVGQSYINTRSVDDTLALSFGRDKKIVVTRNKLKDFSNEKGSGTNRKVTYSYEIVVKNNHKSPVQIDLEDQLPISQNSEIVVDAIELSKAEYNPLTGQVKWKMSLNPDESKKVILTFSVKYPKNKVVDLSKRRTKYRAKF